MAHRSYYYRKKTKKRFRIRHLLITVFGMYLVFVFVNQQIQINSINKSQQEVEREIKAALEEKHRIEEQIKLLNEDEYIEEIARKELGLVKPGEVIYKVLPSKQPFVDK